MKLPFKSKAEFSQKQADLSESHFSVDFAGLLKGYLFVYGWLDNPKKNLQHLLIYDGKELLSKKKLETVHRFFRPDVDRHLNRPEGIHRAGFMSVFPVEKEGVSAIEISFEAEGELLPKKQKELEEYTEESFENLIEGVSGNSYEGLANYLQNFGLLDTKAKKKPKKSIKNEETEVQAFVDHSIAYQNHLFISGWITDTQNEIRSISILKGNKAILKVLKEQLIRTERKDVQSFMKDKGVNVPIHNGFIWSGLLNETEGNEPLSLMVEGENKQEIKTIELNLKDTNPKDFKKVTQKVFSCFSSQRPNLFDVYNNCVGPFLEGLKPLWMKEKKVKVFSFGDQTLAPKASIIIPLYGRWDFLNYQLAIFSNDSDITNNCELIYVVDDPTILESVINHSKSIYPVFGQSFKVVEGGDNFGYAGANNLGVSQAIGEYLVLLNSDVMPKEKGWVSRLVNQFERLPNCGLVGPRLVYEDESIQHEGMTFEKSPFLEKFWFNIHPGKGQPKWVFSGVEPRVVNSLTGACLIIKTQDYLDVGGLDEGYLQGDFEDSDLNLKIRKQGKLPYLIPNEELYHLERKSQSLFSNSDWKLKLTLFNAWQHTKKWDAQITELVNADKNE